MSSEIGCWDSALKEFYVSRKGGRHSRQRYKIDEGVSAVFARGILACPACRVHGAGKGGWR